MAARVPQFDLPFRFDAGGQAVEVEQDSLDDIANCVEAVLRTRIGQRDEHPRFGTPDLAFMPLPLPLDQLAQQVREWEPRADLEWIEQNRGLFEETVVRLHAEVTKGG